MCSPGEWCRQISDHFDGNPAAMIEGANRRTALSGRSMLISGFLMPEGAPQRTLFVRFPVADLLLCIGHQLLSQRCISSGVNPNQLCQPVDCSKAIF